MALFDTIRAGASGADTGFTVDRSLRFNDDDSPRINRTPSSSGNRQTWTKSFWVKRGQIMRTMLTAYYISSTDVAAIEFGDNHNLHFYDFYNGYRLYFVTSRVFRDPSAWYHIVIALDTTQSTSSNRVKIYVNGEQETSFSTETYPSQNLNVSFNQNVLEAWGTEGTNQRLHFDGYMSEITYIDGLQLTPSSFGETNTDTGQWNPIDTSGLTYGTNGYRLQFADNSGTSATTLGKDTSGNGNNWTPVNFGTGDAVKDTPTNNFCTLSSIADARGAYGSSTIGEANLRYTGGSSNRTVASTFGISPSDTKGYYFEGRIMSGNESNRLFFGIGLTSTNWISTDARGANDDSWVLRNGDGAFLNNGSSANDNGATSVGQILQIAVKGSKIWVGTNNTWHASGDPAAGSNEKYSNIADTWTPVLDLMTSNVFQFNFGQDSSFSNTVTAQGNTDANGNGDFYYAPPTGFFAMCSANLPDPTILLPNQYFNTLLWTGNDSSDRDITGVGFQPDWVWIKNRQGPDWNCLADTVRGINTFMFSNNTDADDTDNTNGHINSVLADGFNVTAGDSGNVNENNEDYVSWNWNAGGSTVTNSNGSISSQVRANTSAGFSIITYSGNSSSGSTVGHGLGVKPDLIIIKARNAGDNWMFYHKKLNNGSSPEQYYLELNESGQLINDSRMMNDTAPTSTVFSLRADGSTNYSGRTYVAYCFSEVAGYSKFGSYTGNGNADGPFIFTNFRPALVIAKRTDSSGFWRILDNKRDPHNVAHHALFANDNSNESDTDSSSSYNTDFLSNGFKLRTTLASSNSSGGTWIYMAWAESPFKNARAR